MPKLSLSLSLIALFCISPVYASVNGVTAWVIPGSNGPYTSGVSPNQFQFAIGVTDSNAAPTVYFHQLSFGYSTSVAGRTISAGSWPLSPDITYLSSDQPSLAAVNLINLTPSTEYFTEVWAFDSGNRFNTSFSVTTPALRVNPLPRTPDATSTLPLVGLALLGIAIRAVFNRVHPDLAPDETPIAQSPSHEKITSGFDRPPVGGDRRRQSNAAGG